LRCAEVAVPGAADHKCNETAVSFASELGKVFVRLVCREPLAHRVQCCLLFLEEGVLRVM
jgi:hypothetical protein